MQTDMLVDANQGSLVSKVPPASGSSNINVGNSERVISTIAGVAAAAYGLRNISSIGGIAMAVAGGMLLSRGVSGFCAVNKAIGRNSAVKHSGAIEAHVKLNIERPRHEVYAFWRRLENLPSFMSHLEQVQVHDELRSTWTAKVPGGLGTISWEAEIDEDRPGELISWSSLPGSTIDNAGEVRFEDARNGSTMVDVRMDYRLPGGDLGSIAGKLFNPAVENVMKSDIEGFKTIMETSGGADGFGAGTGDFSVSEGTGDDFTTSGLEESPVMGETQTKSKKRTSRKKTGGSFNEDLV